jgi:CRP/FNR family transcriptional regulator
MTMPNGRRQIVEFLFTGDICGVMQSHGEYAFDCEAIIKATTCAVDVSQLQKLVLADRDVARSVEKQILVLHRRIAEHLVVVGQLNAKNRLLDFLHRLRRVYAERGIPTDPLWLPMTREDIGDHLGMRLETVCRVFSELQERHLLDRPRFEQVVLGHPAPDGFSMLPDTPRTGKRRSTMAATMARCS